MFIATLVGAATVLLFCATLAAGKSVSIQGQTVGTIAKQKCQEFPTDSDGTSQVQGGMIAANGDFPYMAAVGFHQDKDFIFACGASLISNEYLLTAAHCFREGKLTVARFGVVKLFNYLPEDPPVDIELNDPIYHPDRLNNDIALVQLKRSIHEDEEYLISPICLYTEPEDPRPETVLTIAGWGEIDTNSDERYTLRKGPVNVWPHERCSKVVKGQNLRVALGHLGNKICASKLHANGSTEVDTCKGDSGGPLELAQNSRRYLVGITSKGVSCGTTGKPGYYTRVARYIGWIESIVWPQ